MSDPTPEADTEVGGENELDALKRKLAEAETLASENWDKLLRAQAEVENVRKRAERETMNAYKFAAEKVLADLLAVCDSLELGLKAAQDESTDKKAVVDGLVLTQKQLTGTLEKNGVKPLDPAGQPFDPDKHEAMSMVPSQDVPPNHVLSVMQKGYTLHERLLRPAMVVVAKAPPADEAKADA